MKEYRNETLTRRQALKASAVAVGAAALAPIAACGQQPGGGTVAPATPDRSGVPKNMQLSLAAYSMRDELTKGRLDLFGFIDYCAELDLPGTELTSYYFKEGFDKAYLREVKRHALRSGITVSGTAIGNDFCQLTKEGVQNEIAKVRQWIDYSVEFFAPHIRIFAGALKEGMEKQSAIIQVADAIKACLDYAAERGVFLGLENHGGITALVEDHLAICDAVGEHPWFGINLDTGNYRTDAYNSLAKAAPRSVNVQVKVDINDDQGNRSDVDLERIRRILVDAGYKGWVALEYEGQDPPREAIPMWIARMKQYFECGV